jgi:hypothetical protein
MAAAQPMPEPDHNKSRPRVLFFLPFLNPIVRRLVGAGLLGLTIPPTRAWRSC